MMFGPPVHFFWLFWVGVIVLVMIAVALAVLRGVLFGPVQHPYPPVPPQGPQPQPPAAASEAPLDILARRFARGEITAEEYQKARDLLGGGGGPA